MFLETHGEILVEALEIVDSGTGVDFLGVGGDQGWLDLLASLEFLEVFVDNSRLESRHSN